MTRLRIGAVAGLTVFMFASGAAAQDASVAACKATGLVALQQKSADVTDLVIDQESVAVSAADTTVQDVPVKTVVLGEAYI